MLNSRERSVIAELNEAYLERTDGEPPEKTKILCTSWEITPSGQKHGQQQATSCRPSAETVGFTIAQPLPESCCPQTSWPHLAGLPICRPHGVWGPRSFPPWIAEEVIWWQEMPCIWGTQQFSYSWALFALDIKMMPCS